MVSSQPSNLCIWENKHKGARTSDLDIDDGPLYGVPQLGRIVDARFTPQTQLGVHFLAKRISTMDKERGTIRIPSLDSIGMIWTLKRALITRNILRLH